MIRFRLPVLAGLLGWLLVVPMAAGKAPSPPYYVKQPTWQETLRASREALLKWEAEEAQAAGRGGKPPRKNRKKDPRRVARQGLWKRVSSDRSFRGPVVAHQMALEQKDGIWNADWKSGDLADLARRYARAIALPTIAKQAQPLLKSVRTPAGLEKVRTLYYKAKRVAAASADIARFNFQGFRLAVQDLAATYPGRYKKGPEYLRRLAAAEKAVAGLAPGVAKGDPAAIEKLAALGEELAGLRREAFLANPLLDFDRLLVIKRTFGPSARKVISGSLGLPTLNSHTHDTIRHKGWDNAICILTDLGGEGRLQTLYRPSDGEILCEMDLDFGGDRLMFSSIGTNDRWQLFEIGADPASPARPKQLTPTDLPDVDFFDSCYLPNGAIAVTSTAGFQGLPCENGGKPMAQMYLLDPRTKQIRQITFEQDSDWCPTVLNNGRLMYLRWEYTDMPHYFSRILFHSNPDGTEQMELYGSGSYFPNAFFYARPIPGHPTKIVGIAGGHHGISRSGRMLIIDPAVGRHEADGIVQEIPGYGKMVEPIIRDRLIDGVWPQFLHPYPLSEKYFLVAGKLTADALWGIYLVDVFDNLTLVKEVEGAALLEPMPLRPTPRPPVIQPKVQLARKDAAVYLMNVTGGRGLKGVAPGAVKRLRLIAYHYAYNHRGGHASVGIESSWDVKRILGTVPVEPDGSAYFRIPANTPISVQPLDADGRALALMRSWFVGTPGEVLACVGCHEKQRQAPPNAYMQAVRRPPSEIRPFYGPPRPFGFKLEVQPVLDEYCVACHDGKPRSDGSKLPNFADRTLDYVGPKHKATYSKFSSSYAAIQPYVRRPGPESDFHMLRPMEYHASTSELVQMLQKGHHNVQLDTEAWDRLYTWIDLNAPYVARWDPPEWRGDDQRRRRLELAERYANVDADPEAEYQAAELALLARGPVTPVKPKPLRQANDPAPQLASWPFAGAEARRRQAAAGAQPTRTVDLGGGATMEMARIPAGEFVMGEARGDADEQPLAAVTIERPFWMGVCEVTNAQFRQFDPAHDSAYIDQAGKDHRNQGYPANLPTQPVIRVTWKRALAFCRWLSAKTGRTFTLPTEAQWEWACRAGTATPLWYGDTETDFSRYANLADAAGSKLRTTPFPTDRRFNDGQGLPTAVGRYLPNPWGLKDMHGGVAEWTRTTYKPYPYNTADGRDAGAADGPKVVRGGSWRDRPRRCRSAFRLAYQPYQPVVNVGFRVICEAAKRTKRLASGTSR